MTSNPIQPMSNGTPEYRHARSMLYTNTKIGNSMLSAARSGFDAGRFKAMQANILVILSTSSATAASTSAATIRTS